MTTSEKIKAADEVMDRMEHAGCVFTEEQRQFNRGYLAAMIDASEAGLFKGQTEKDTNAYD